MNIGKVWALCQTEHASCWFILFDPEDGIDIILRNVNGLLPNHMSSKPTRSIFSIVTAVRGSDTIDLFRKDKKPDLFHFP
jgi:hypothetical protein